MFAEPEYGQDIVVGVVFHHVFAWYVTDKEYWYLDYTKYDAALQARGFKLPVEKDYSSRWDIAILDAKTAEIFLHHINERHVPADELSRMIITRKRVNKEDDLLDFAPSLWVDFDHNHLFSQYAEMIRFEFYVPDGWVGAYQDFTLQVPEEERYWIINDRNIFKEP